MKRMLINATNKKELRIALVDGQRLYNLDIENIVHAKKKSNVYKGKIVSIEPSLSAAFVDYGAKKHGFLPFKEISEEYFHTKYALESTNENKKILEEGQEILVQINKEERGNKGASLTTFISLAGSYLVLMPNNPHIEGISRRIEKNHRHRIKNILPSLHVPKNMGLIVRTAGLGKSFEVLECDLSFCLKHWENIIKTAQNCSAPFLIHQESNIIIRAFRDYLNAEIEEILVDNPNIMNVLKNYIDSLGRIEFMKKIKLYHGNTSLFDHYQIEYQIKSSLKRKVRLPSGGSLIIDSTEALTAIDINSERSTKGNSFIETALDTNLEAANEIARQLRLRDLGGLIVIDFIDMPSIEHQRKLELSFRKAVQQDRARIHIGQVSKFGLLELSRQRLSDSSKRLQHYRCSQCKQKELMDKHELFSLYILRLIKRKILRKNIVRMNVFVPVDVASYLFHKKQKAIDTIQNKIKNVKIMIVPQKKMKFPQFTIFEVSKNQTSDKF